MRYLLLTTTFFFILGLTNVSGQTENVEFIANSKSTVNVGEQFRVVFTVNSKGKDFHIKPLQGFNILSGPNPSTSSSIQIINGKYTRTVSNSYTYYLVASQEGDFEIPPATIVINGKQYSSNSLKIKVVSSTTPSKPGTQGQGTKPGSSQGMASADLYIKASVDRNNAFIGEQIIVTYKIYTTVPIPQYSVNKYPSYSGFWAQDLKKDNERPSQQNEIINGRQYLVAEFKKVALFPLKSGKLTIEPINLNVVAQIRTQRQQRSRDPFFDSFFDDAFFGGGYQNIERVLKTNTITLNIKPLPLQDRPVDFKNAVGQFSFKSNIDKTKVKTNEAINLKFTIWGKGNIKLIDKLNINFPPDFEVYDPKTNNKINIANDGVNGVRTIEYLIIPRNAGNFMVQPVRFSYFDQKKKQYVTLSSPEYIISVEKIVVTPSDINYSGTAPEDIRYIGRDIRYIKSLPFTLYKTGSYFFASSLYFIFLIGSLIISLIILILWNNFQKQRSNIQLRKTRKATKVAKSRLKNAETYLKKRNEANFFNEVSLALWGYLSDKFNIPLSDLSMDSAHEALSLKGVKEEISSQFLDILNQCEYARFSPAGESGSMEKIYSEAILIISKTERGLK